MQPIRRARLPLVHRKAGYIHTCQIMLGHKAIASTKLYIGIEEEVTLNIGRRFEL